MFQRWSRLYFVLAAEFDRVRVTQIALVLKAWRGLGELWRLGTVRDQERYSFIGKGTALEAVEDPELKGSWREVEAWQHEERLRQAIGESAAQLHQCQYHEITTSTKAVVGGACQNLEDKLCVLQRAELEKESRSWVDPRNWILYYLHCWFCFEITVTLSWFFLLKTKYLT